MLQQETIKLMYLLDTNILSELTRTQPNSSIIDFIQQARIEDKPLFLSVITLGEINKGIAKLKRYGDTAQANKFSNWLQQIRQEFTNNILDIDSEITLLWGHILASTDDTNAIDKLIAATALIYDLTIVSRNTKHLDSTGAKSINPFSESM